MPASSGGCKHLYLDGGRASAWRCSVLGVGHLLLDELMALWERTRRTVIMVTHDVDEAILLADRIVMMTNGPAATIGEIFDVPFARPRRRENLLDRPDYFWLRDSILAFLEAEVHA